jgi:hypothetical protein
VYLVISYLLPKFIWWRQFVFTSSQTFINGGMNYPTSAPKDILVTCTTETFDKNVLIVKFKFLMMVNMKITANLGYDTMMFGSWVPTFWRNTLPPSSGYKSEDRGCRFLQKVCTCLPNCGVTSQKTMVNFMTLLIPHTI